MNKDRLEIGLDCTHVKGSEAVCLDCFYNVVDQLEAQVKVERSEVERLRGELRDELEMTDEIIKKNAVDYMTALTTIATLRGEIDDRKNWVSGAWANSQRLAIDNLVEEAEEKDAIITTLRGLLETADRLYTTSGLLAQHSDCGPWINSVRKAIAPGSKEEK